MYNLYTAEASARPGSGEIPRGNEVRASTTYIGVRTRRRGEVPTSDKVHEVPTYANMDSDSESESVESMESHINVLPVAGAIEVQGTLFPKLVLRTDRVEWRVVVTDDTRLALPAEFRVDDQVMPSTRWRQCSYHGDAGEPRPPSFFACVDFSHPISWLFSNCVLGQKAAWRSWVRKGSDKVTLYTYTRSIS